MQIRLWKEHFSANESNPVLNIHTTQLQLTYTQLTQSWFMTWFRLKCLSFELWVDLNHFLGKLFESGAELTQFLGIMSWADSKLARWVDLIQIELSLSQVWYVHCAIRLSSVHNPTPGGSEEFSFWRGALSPPTHTPRSRTLKKNPVDAHVFAIPCNAPVFFTWHWHAL